MRAMVWAPAPGPDHCSHNTVTSQHFSHTVSTSCVWGGRVSSYSGPSLPPVSILVTGVARECSASVHLWTHRVFPPRASRHSSLVSMVVTPTEERRLVEEDGS